MTAKLVVGNWKMNGSLAANLKLVKCMLEDRRINRKGVVLVAPFVYLWQLMDLLQLSSMALGAQDVSQFGQEGAFTGEVSAAMLADVGCRYVLIGHSERRQYLAETDGMLKNKLENAFAVNLVPILCVGETLSEREAGQHLNVIRHQLAVAALFSSEQLIVAYEPIWAIGTGKVASLVQIAEMHEWIKAVSLQSPGGSASMRVLYGGSVKADNAEAILSISSVDGALVGGASLDINSFGTICQTADKLV